MLLDDFRVVADQPFPADGETAQAFAFRDSGFLENPKTAAPRSNKDKLCPVFTDLIRGEIFDTNIPARVGSLEVNDTMIAGDTTAVLP